MKLTPAKATLALAQDRREVYAREIFEYETVTSLIIAAATMGESYVRINQNMPVYLNGMKATRLLVAALQEADYKIEWVTASQPEKCNGRETGGFIKYEEMRISWDKVNVFSGPSVSSE